MPSAYVEKHNIFLASRIVDELVNFAFEERDFPKRTAEKIVADLVSTSLVERKRETAETGVETVKVKTKSRKSNTETKEYLDAGCDSDHVECRDTGCDPEMKAFADVGCDPVPELSVALDLVDTGCDALVVGLMDADVQVIIVLAF